MKKCIIEIKDEVNCKLVGLEPDARRALVNAFKYDVPGARYLPAVRLGRWDGKVSFFQLGGSTFLNLLPDIVPILDKFNYDIDLDDQRDYSTVYEFTKVTESTFNHLNWGEGHPAAGKPIILRDYQVDIINNFLSNPQCVQEVATGAGKCLSGDTLLSIDIDENTPFGKFIVNKLQQGQGNDVTTNNRKL
jgi:hypothetical protein